MFALVVLATLALTAKLDAVAGAYLETVVHRQHTLRPGYIDAQRTGFTSTCECREMCLSMNCSTYSVTVVTVERLMCQFSLTPVPLQELMPQQPGTKSHVVHLTDYKHIGNHYYRILTDIETKRVEAREKCLDDGGQLAVVNSNELMEELEQAMEAVGVQAAWVGLFRARATGGDFSTAAWELNNGTYIEDAAVPIQVERNRCFFFDLSAPLTERLNNRHDCKVLLLAACQRNY